MAKSKMSIDILNTGKINTLIFLLNKYKKELPEELVLKLKQILSGDAFCYKAKDIDLMMSKIDMSLNRDRFSGEFKLMADGVELKHINQVNTLLRTVKAMSLEDHKKAIIAGGVSSFDFDIYEPKEMVMTYDDKILISWPNELC